MALLLRWTRDKPTAPGFYWMKGEGTRSRVVEIQDGGRYGLYVVHIGRALDDLPSDGFAWAGPMEEPPAE